MVKHQLGLLLVPLLFPFHINGEIILRDAITKDRVVSFRSEDASFGRSFPEEGFVGRIIAAEPLTACLPIKKAPKIPSNSTTIHHFIVLISRYGGCNFEEKIKRATDANFSAAIVFNINSDRVIPMGGSGGDKLVPSTFIGNTDGDLILRRYTFYEDNLAQFVILPEDPFDINTYLLPFAIVVGICFLIMLGIVIYKCIQDHRRSRRHRLPKSALKKLPVIKFKPGTHPYETCCICLGDYEENDKLRILPCDHGYHKTCIDPWLVKNKRVCPQCRKKVFPREQESDDDSDTGETAPLLRNSRRPLATSGGTFHAEGTFAAAVASRTERRRRNFLSRLRRQEDTSSSSSSGRAAVASSSRVDGYIDNEIVERQSSSTISSDEEEVQNFEHQPLINNHVAIIHTIHTESAANVVVVPADQIQVEGNHEVQIISSQPPSNSSSPGQTDDNQTAPV